MIRRLKWTLIWAVLLLASQACSKKALDPQLTVVIPAGFSGNFQLEMGVKDTPPLDHDGDHYTVTVPPNGKVITSTLLRRPHVNFKNDSGGAVWGYSQSVSTTGDGILVGGKIQFFVGTRKQYDAEENRKDHSEDVPVPPGDLDSGT